MAWCHALPSGMAACDCTPIYVRCPSLPAKHQNHSHNPPTNVRTPGVTQPKPHFTHPLVPVPQVGPRSALEEQLTSVARTVSAVKHGAAMETFAQQPASSAGLAQAGGASDV